MTEPFVLNGEEKLLLVDALACLIDACHWAGAGDTDRAEKVMDLYQKMGGELLNDEDDTN